MKTKTAWLLGLAVIGGVAWYFAHNHQRAAEIKKQKTFTFEEATVAPVKEHTVILAFAWKDIEKFQKAMHAHKKDLLALANDQHAKDVDKIFALLNEAEKYSDELEHIYAFLLVDALVQNEADRERIKTVICGDVKTIQERIDQSIERVNLNLGYLKGTAIIATAIRLREDLRELNAVLLIGN